ncbi:MAG: class I SAM-dependent rRNA methyltransferase, partial [Clostridia bacterium]|nr:class I SAM-dependent rRNA methyltransferase [Clostridia bacterium]
MSAPRLTLQKGRERGLRGGYGTVYAGDVAKMEGDILPGAVADVVTATGRFVGRGLLSPRSKMLLRLLTDKEEPIDAGFFARRLEAALDYRRLRGLAGGAEDCCRLVFGDADRLPGLTVDRFGPVLSIQTLTAGMDARKELLCDLLEQLLHPVAIYERNDVKVRQKEGLPPVKGLLRGTLPRPLLVRENGLLVEVDVEGGQKTGSYLDQRENHAAIAPYVAGKRVLDACCCTGGFGLHAAFYGAASVTLCDISQTALDQARENFSRNGLLNEGITFIKEDIFDLLPRLGREGAEFDVVILDPPAFCKNKSALAGAWRGYKEINLRAMALLPAGGILVTNSCSQ